MGCSGSRIPGPYDQWGTSTDPSASAGDDWGPKDDYVEEGDIPDVSRAGYVPFREFPTPSLLREANTQYNDVYHKMFPKRDNTGEWLPYPTPNAKKDVFSVDKYEDIDKHANQVPTSVLHGSMSDLANYLCKPARDDMSKVRAIFRWTTSHNINTLCIKEEIPEGSPLSKLMELQKEEAYHNDVFVDLCRACGLQAKEITGLLKGSQYVTGEVISDNLKGSWVAVMVDKAWRLFDPSWSARQIKGGCHGEWMLIDDDGQGIRQTDSESTSLIYNYDESFFAADPEILIYSHYPLTDEDWQLLARPVTRQEFSEMAHLRHAFYNLGLSLVSHRMCVIYAQEGEIEIELGLPSERRKFAYRLWLSTEGHGERQETVGQFKLERFAFMQQLENSLIIKLYLPTTGKFKFDLYCKNSESVETDKLFEAVCTYVVCCEKAKDDIHPFPENNRKDWGPGQDLIHAGLHAVSHKEAVIESEDGTVQIRLKADKHLDVLHELHSNTKSKTELKNFVIHYTEGDIIVLEVKLPEAGEYALNLYAAKVHTVGAFPNVCTYLITSDVPAFDPTPFPSIHEGKLGITNAGKALGALCTSHKVAFINASSSRELTIHLKMESSCNVVANLNFQNKEQTVNRDQYTMLTRDDMKSACINIRLPNEGMYSLKIFGALPHEDSTSMHNIYNFIVKVPQPTETCTPFPKPTSSFANSQCKVGVPLTMSLPSNKSVPFSIEMKGAGGVAVIVGEKWEMMIKHEADVWKGDAKTGEAGSVVKLVAQLEKSNKFSILLTYEVASEEDISKEFEAHEYVRKKALSKIREEEKRNQNRQEDLKATHTALKRAIRDRDPNALKKLLMHIRQKGYVSSMKDDVTKAKELTKSLDRIQGLNHDVLTMDEATMLKIWQYTTPPKLVHGIMVASLLILGHHEGKTRNWTQCQKMCNSLGPQGLTRRVKQFDILCLHPEIASRARQLISLYRLDHVMDTSAGAGAFYKWTLGMTLELRKMRPDTARAPPASLRRQKKIFSK